MSLVRKSLARESPSPHPEGENQGDKGVDICFGNFSTKSSTNNPLDSAAMRQEFQSRRPSSPSSPYGGAKESGDDSNRSLKRTGTSNDSVARTANADAISPEAAANRSRGDRIGPAWESRQGLGKSVSERTQAGESGRGQENERRVPGKVGVAGGVGALGDVSVGQGGGLGPSASPDGEKNVRRDADRSFCSGVS